MFRNLITGGTCALAAVMLTACAGCATLKGEKSLTESLPWIGKKDKEKPYPNPAKIAVTWAPDVIFRPGSTPTRGFGGRIFFYDEKSRPVPVEGELAVHGFEDVASGQPPTVKRFAFTPEQFTSHFSQTDLGASYSIWIPWDAAGGRESRITLVPSFRTVGGKVVQGTAAVVLLPGRSDRSPGEPSSSSDHPSWPPQQLPAGSGLSTTTIPAGDMGRRMARLPAQTLPPVNAPAAHAAPAAPAVVPASHQGPRQPAPASPTGWMPAVAPARPMNTAPVTAPNAPGLPNLAEVIGAFE